MREKILAQLIAKYAGVSKTALGLIADKLAKKVTEDSGIEQAITDFDNAISITEFAADLQREADRRVTDAKKQWEKENPKPKPGKDGTDDDPPNPGGEPEPAWLKKLTGELTGLKEQVSTLSKEKAQGTIKTKATELLKDVPAHFWNGRTIPDKEEDLQAFVDSVNTDYTAFKQDLIDKGLMSATPPAGGGGAGGGSGKPSDKVLDAEIKEWADKGKAETASSDKK